MTGRTACARIAAALLVAIATAAAAQGPATDGPIRLVPAELQDSTWLQRAAAAQARAASSLTAFHGFQFTDRLVESGITFKHGIVADAGKSHKAVHYDHGNGLAVADVDADGRLDVYFVNQVG